MHPLFGYRYGVIPTRMGNVVQTSDAVMTRQDHLHAYGEYDNDTCSSFQSPGIIPTCMGNIALFGSMLMLRRDHPHLRGEHFLRTVDDWRLLGLSPLVRGISVLSFLTIVIFRVIPTRMGNIGDVLLRVCVALGYPYAYREYFLRDSLSFLAMG